MCDYKSPLTDDTRLRKNCKMENVHAGKELGCHNIEILNIINVLTTKSTF